MSRRIDPNALKAHRQSRGLSQAQLARQSKVSQKTIFRLENQAPGQYADVRLNTINRLAEFFRIPATRLEGTEPFTSVDPRREAEPDRSQVAARVSPAVRNAFDLVAWRYNVRLQHIIELAPFLFSVAAEASLEWRRRLLEELKALASREDDVRGRAPYLTVPVAFQRDEEAEVEAQSIEACDILGELLTESDRLDGPASYSDGADNPFAAFLREFASEAAPFASIREFSRFETDYDVCPDEIDRLAMGDETLARGIREGTVLLKDIPARLRSKEHAVERAEWLRARIAEEIKESIAALPLGLDGEESRDGTEASS